MFELVPAILSIPVGIYVGKLVELKNDSNSLGILSGVVSIPVSYLVLAYGLMLIVVLPIILCDKVFGGTSARDEYFDDP